MPGRKEKLPRSLLAALFFLLLSAGLCALIWSTEVPEPRNESVPVTAFQSDGLRGVVAGVTVLGLLVVVALRRFRPKLLEGRLRTALKVAAVLLVIFGSLVYFYIPRGVARPEYLNHHDLYHYFLGLKYYPEVSYENFYACHLKADHERSRPRYRDRDAVRDLLTYEVRRAKDIRPRADCSHFTPERWREFNHDIDYFDRHMARTTLTDQGYNGTPFHALVAGAISQLPEVDRRGLIAATFVDVVGLCALFAVLSWAFGWEIAFLVALFQFANFADFYFHVSFFRYWWLITLGVGLACLHKKRYGAAAVFLVVSAMLNVFPLLFVTGIALKILVQLVRERRLAPHYKTFVAWAAAATVICGAASMVHDRPVERYDTFFSKMHVHSRLLSAKRIGFQYAFMYRGEITEQDRNTSYDRKERDLRDMRVVFRLIVGAILIFAAFVIVRLDDVQAAVLSGFLLFFLLFSTVAYYYASAAFLVLLWAGELRRSRGALLTALLFALMGVVYVAWEETRFREFVNNTVLTGIFTLYLAVVLAVLARSTGLARDAAAMVRRLRKRPAAT